MKKFRTIAGMLVAGALVTSVMAETTATSGKMLRMQPGNAVYTILDSSGVRPMPGAQLAIRDMQDGEALATAVADKAGRAIVELTEGRFILSVGALNLSVLDVALDAEHTECRIVMPTQDMLVGGQDEEGDVAVVPPMTMGSTLMTPVVIAGGLVLVGGAAYAIDETSSSSSTRIDGDVAGVQPAPIVRQRTSTQYVPVPVPPTPGY